MTSRFAKIVARLPLGWTSLSVLLVMVLAWRLYPEPAPDVVPAEQLAAIQLTLDRLQARLSGEMVRQAADQRRADSPAYRQVSRQVEAACGQLPGLLRAARVWAPEQWFTSGGPGGPVRAVVLLYESAAPEAAAVGLGQVLPVRSALLGPAWYTTETQVSALAESTADLWRLSATTPLFDAVGRTAALVEVRLELPRARPLPLWPRNALLATLALSLLAFWELRLAVFRLPLRRAFRLPISTATWDESSAANPADVAARTRIDHLASQAKARDRLWLVRPAELDDRQEGTRPAPLELPLVRTGPGVERPSATPADEPIVSTVIEDEALLRRLLDEIWPRLSGSGPRAGGGRPALEGLSLRFVIEIRRRESPPTADAPAQRDASDHASPQ